MLEKKPKRHRFPASVMSHVIWLYHRFNLSYRDIAEQMLDRGIGLSHETIRQWCLKFGSSFSEVIRKKGSKNLTDKWHLDEMNVKVGGEKYVLWRAVDSEGRELDIFLQRRRNKKSAIRFLSRLLDKYPAPRVAVTDKLPSYKKPIKQMSKRTDHRSHKRLNNRIENAHQPTRRKEKVMIKFKSPFGVQKLLSLMGQVRNLFALSIGRYKKAAHIQRGNFQEAKNIWQQTAHNVFCLA